MGHSQHHGFGCCNNCGQNPCGCDGDVVCGPRPKNRQPPTPPTPPGPSPLPQPCAVSVSDAFIRALLALLATPQQLATFSAFLNPSATLTVDGNPTVTGIAAIVAELTLPPFVATALRVDVLTTAFVGNATGVQATAQVNLVYTLPTGAVVTIPATFVLQFNAQCQIVSITILADFSPLG